MPHTDSNPPPAADIPFDNLRGLVQDLVVELDARITAYRQGTRYERVRPFDVKVFILASRQPRPVSQLARELGVSRQAVHAAVKRLASVKVLEVEANPENGREKRVAVTQRGDHARITALQQIARLEEECSSILGSPAMEGLRDALAQLVTGLKQRRLAGTAGGAQATGVKS